MAQHLNVIPRKHLCDQLGISRNTIKRWIEYRGFPKPLEASGQEPLFDTDSGHALAYIEKRHLRTLFSTLYLGS